MVSSIFFSRSLFDSRLIHFSQIRKVHQVKTNYTAAKVLSKKNTSELMPIPVRKVSKKESDTKISFDSFFAKFKDFLPDRNSAVEAYYHYNKLTENNEKLEIKPGSIL